MKPMNEKRLAGAGLRGLMVGAMALVLAGCLGGPGSSSTNSLASGSNAGAGQVAGGESDSDDDGGLFGGLGLGNLFGGDDSDDGAETSEASGEESESDKSWFEETFGSAEEIGETLVGPGMVPSLLALAEETCVAREVLAGNTDSLGGQVAINVGMNIIQKVIEKETGRTPMFCEQNFVGLLLMTDKLMLQSIDEVRLGIEAANSVLGDKKIDIRSTLRDFNRARRGGLSTMQSADVTATIVFIGTASAAIGLALEERIKQGGLSDETVARLLQSIQHLSNAAYLRGKLVVAGFIINRAVATIGGGAALTNVAGIELTGLRKNFLKDLPRNSIELVAATAKTFVLIGLIGDARDTDEFDLALEEVKTPSKAVVLKINAEAAEVQSKYANVGAAKIGDAVSSGGFGSVFKSPPTS